MQFSQRSERCLPRSMANSLSFGGALDAGSLFDEPEAGVVVDEFDDPLLD
ncbi:MAG: hypothetical protein MZV49_17490 [Rhodopseudomonas palustris]|nr:hypothetical protein [Rhodopseudomonas palustris]